MFRSDDEIRDDEIQKRRSDLFEDEFFIEIRWQRDFFRSSMSDKRFHWRNEGEERGDDEIS